MNDITINVDNTKLLSEEILTLVSDYHDIIDKIRAEVNDIQDSGIWNGNDSNNFLEVSSKYLTSFENVEDTLKFYGEFLKHVGDVYYTLENDYSNRSRYE